MPGSPADRLHTHTGHYDAASVRVRGRDLVDELIGRCTFTEMLYFLTCGRMPSAGQTRVLDACLVTLMEHGLTPSAVIARLMADSVPEEPQVAVAGGLLAIGSVFAGTTEDCARLLAELAGLERAAEGAGAASVLRDRVQAMHRARSAVPGFGHGTHKPDDPRSPRLFAVADEAGASGAHTGLLRRLAPVVDEVYGRHLTINATGAMGALFLDIGIPLDAMRCFSVVSRAGGLVGHLLEERQTHSGREIWKMSKQLVPYRDPPREG